MINMALYMPPMLTKGRVRERYDPDTRRIFGKSNKIEAKLQSHYSETHTAETKEQIAKRPASKNRHHKPHPQKVGFLEQDCRLLHQPICRVATKNLVTEAKQDHWWPSRTSEEPLKKPEYSYGTTSRSDFCKKDEKSLQTSRHGSNPNCIPARGIVPVNHLPAKNGPRLLVEKISYSHQYDSRTKPNQPIRGKLHGSLVWDTLYPVNMDGANDVGSSMPPASSPT